jgi:hypothetical protein
VIRAEFQCRRESLGALQIDTFADLCDLLPNLWQYLTRKWLRIVDDRRKARQHRRTRPWWHIVQNGVGEDQAEIYGARGENRIPGTTQNATPLVRAKAVKATKDQLLRQLFGQFISYLALQSNDTPENADPIPVAESMQALADEADAMGLDGYKIREKVNGRLSRYRRDFEKFEQAAEYRKESGISAARNVRSGMRNFRRMARKALHPMANQRQANRQTNQRQG